MNPKRLKFAWARGARVQSKDLFLLEWATYAKNKTPPFWLGEEREEFELRIHPDDAHLQYGPVSMAFRDMALFTDNAELPEEVELFMDLAGSNWVLGTLSEALPLSTEDIVAAEQNDILIDWTRLLFAEYLADLGL